MNARPTGVSSKDYEPVALTVLSYGPPFSNVCNAVEELRFSSVTKLFEANLKSQLGEEQIQLFGSVVRCQSLNIPYIVKNSRHLAAVAQSGRAADSDRIYQRLKLLTSRS